MTNLGSIIKSVLNVLSYPFVVIIMVAHAFVYVPSLGRFYAFITGRTIFLGNAWAVLTFFGLTVLALYMWKYTRKGCYWLLAIWLITACCGAIGAFLVFRMLGISFF